MIRTDPTEENETSPKLRRGTTASSDIDGFPRKREIQIKRSAFARLALHSDLPRVLLDDAVGDTQTEACPPVLAIPRRCLGSEKRIVDAPDMLLRDAASSICNDDTDAITIGSGNSQIPTAGHRILSVQKQIQKNLLQLAGIPLNERKVVGKLVLNFNLRSLKLVLQQRQRIRHNLVYIDLSELSAAGSGEVQQVIYDFRSTECGTSDLLQQSSARRVALELLGKHLCVRRDHRQRSIHFVRDARREQSDGREFVGLRKLRFQLNSFGDVVHNDQPADDIELSRH